MDTIEMLVDKVEGWLSVREGKLLYEIAKHCSGKGAIVEIGSWQGKSTIWLGKGSQHGKRNKIFAIDPHVGSSEHHHEAKPVWTFPQFERNIKNAKVEDVVVGVVKTSEEAEKSWKEGPVEFLWIDGAHEYDLVYLDYKVWEPHLIDRGIIGFHDTFLGTGPKKVVDRYLYKGDKFKNIRFLEGITYAEKAASITLKDRICNRYALIVRNLYLVLSLFAQRLRIPKPVKRTAKRVVEFFQ